MNRSPLTAVALLCVVAAVVLGVWKASRYDTSTRDEAMASGAEAPRTSKWFWQRDDEARADAAEEPVSPPRARTLHFMKADGVAVAGANVTVFDPKLIDPLRSDRHTFLECDDQQHLAEVAASLRGGELKRTLLVEGKTDENGMVSFEGRLWPEALVLVVDRPGGAPFTTVDLSGRDAFVVPEEVSVAHETAITVFDIAGSPLSARATLMNLGAGDVRELRSDSDGVIRVQGAATFWGIVEAEGYFPVAVNLEDASRDFTIMMSKPGAVEVTAPLALGSFAVQLVKRHPRPVTLRDGRAVFELQRPGYVSVEVIEPGFLGSAAGQLDEGGRLLLPLQVKRAGRLLVTVVTNDGLPVPLASATLTSPSSTSSTGLASFGAGSAEEGQRLELGPVSEGPAVLRVTAPGFKTRAQSLEVAPGDTDLEVVLAEAPSLRGRVIDSKGKPMAAVSVQVRSNTPNDPDGVVTAEDGTFTLHVDEDGAWLVEALGPEGVARATVQVPGPEAVLRLEPLGSAAVTVIGPDGKPAVGARVMLASGESPEPDFGEASETGELLFDQLVPGEYRVEVDDGSSGVTFLPHHQELAIRSGETSRLSVRLRASGTLEGTVVDAENNPVPYAVLTIKGSQSWSAETSEDGFFSMPGLEPGASVELAIELEGHVGLTPSTAKVGVAKQVFKTIAGGKVTGRVVDRQGAPVLEFSVNGVDFSTEDGRFEAVANNLDRLDISDFAGATAEVVVAARKDVGDVTLKESPKLVGVVVDETRQPLAAVRLESSGFAPGEVLTDSQGRFEATLVAQTASVSVQAHHGDLGTFTDVPVGKGAVELVLTPPTRIEGLVRSNGNRAVVTTVLIRANSDEEVQIDTDAEGRFQVSLAPGTWFFGTRASQTSTSVRVSGRQQRVELGIADEACEVTVRGLPLPGSVMLVPASLAWAPAPAFEEGPGDVPPGTVSLGPGGAGFVGRGLSCGAWVVHAMFGTQVVSTPVTLGRGPNTVTVSPPSLSVVGEELGMNHHVPSAAAFRDLEGQNAEGASPLGELEEKNLKQLE